MIGILSNNVVFALLCIVFLSVANWNLNKDALKGIVANAEQAGYISSQR